jgi:outer membrane protein OmpA-like peptidoglycan-associated protein
MRFEPILGAAAIAILGAWSSGAAAQSDAAAPVAGSEIIHLHMPTRQTSGARSGGATIHLHPIRSHGAQTDVNGTQPLAADEAPIAAPETSAPARASKSNGASGKTTIPFNFGEDEGSPPAGSGAPPPAPSKSLKTASIPPHAGSSTHPPATDDEHAGLTKRGAVLFEKGVTDPSPAQFDGVKLLAGDLTTALESGASRIQLEAYGGAPGDKSSDARRLSLKRALAVRQLLIDNGVPSNRIDVRAMGGIDDKGPTDRVDVFIRTS